MQGGASEREGRKVGDQRSLLRQRSGHASQALPLHHDAEDLQSTSSLFRFMSLLSVLPQVAYTGKWFHLTPPGRHPDLSLTAPETRQVLLTKD